MLVDFWFVLEFGHGEHDIHWLYQLDLTLGFLNNVTFEITFAFHSDTPPPPRAGRGTCSS